MSKFLIVVDMQNDFIDGALGTKEALAIVPYVKALVEGFDGKVLFTRDTHFDNYMETQEGKNLPVPHCIKDTDGWQLDTNISLALKNKNYTSVEKPTFGSVALPSLIESLADDEDFSIELVGLCTDICVVSNALLLKANYPEKEISVDPECCAGVTPQSHNAALLTMKMCQIKM